MKQTDSSQGRAGQGVEVVDVQNRIKDGEGINQRKFVHKSWTQCSVNVGRGDQCREGRQWGWLEVGKGRKMGTMVTA